MEISQTALFLGSIIDLYCLVLILRVWLPLANVDYYNPISQFTLKFTQPVIAPLRKVFPAVKKVETAALVLAFLLCGLKSILFGGLNLSSLLTIGHTRADQKYRCGYFLCINRRCNFKLV